MRLREHATGLTFLWVAVLCVGLSLAPLPEALRPFPALRERPRATLQAALLPPLRGRPAAVAPDGAATAGAPDALATAPEGEEEALPPLPEVALPLPPLEEQALVGLGRTEEARQARALEALGGKVGARTVEVEEGCRRQGQGGRCVESALAPFFSALVALRTGEREEPVRALHLGDSLIASDHITDIIRRRLQARHGSGGRGFLFVDRPTRGAGRTVRTGQASAGWAIEKITDRRWPEDALGLSGVAFSTRGSQSERTEFNAAGASVAELWFRTLPKGGALEVRGDGKRLGRVLTRFDEAEPAYARLKVPQGVGRLSVTSAGGPVQLYGVSLESDAPGVIYDSIGLPGATAAVLLRSDETLFREQLRHHDPSLVVLMLGGNEAFELSRNRATLDEARAAFRTLLSRIREALPRAACLLTGTMDAGIRTMGGTITPRAGSEQVSALVREVALESGCAYWDMLSAMGGTGSVVRWSEAGLMNEDLVHPRARGADLLGHLFDMALERSFLTWQGEEARHDAPGLVDASALSPFFQKLKALETDKQGRVAVAQLGASHTAAHYFTDVARARLTQRFGPIGRGFVAAGKSTQRLTPGEVQRELTGSWTVQDATESTEPGGLWGLTGVRAEGQAGASATFRFCQECPEREVRSRLALHYLEAPGMGQLEVLLDGERVARLPLEVEGGGPKEAAARTVLFEAPGVRHTLTVHNRGPGPVALFGASGEQLAPGLVYDAMGLPGSTVFHFAAANQQGLQTQLEARAPDLLVLFWGTNESALPSLEVDAMRRAYATLFSTFRAAAPQASCLIIGPTDRMSQERDGRWREAPSQRAVVAGVRQVAREQGCAFWSARAAMGGPGAIQRWLRTEPPLAHPDRVHLTVPGYEKLATSFVEDLLAAYEEAR